MKVQPLHFDCNCFSDTQTNSTNGADQFETVKFEAKVFLSLDFNSAL